jgi:hypothetical protein
MRKQMAGLVTASRIVASRMRARMHRDGTRRQCTGPHLMAEIRSFRNDKKNRGLRGRII